MAIKNAGCWFKHLRSGDGLSKNCYRPRQASTSISKSNSPRQMSFSVVTTGQIIQIVSNAVVSEEVGLAPLFDIRDCAGDLPPIHTAGRKNRRDYIHG